MDGVNAKSGGIKLKKLSGDYDLGYLYGNVKTHKPGNPIRPIISQIPTPTYRLAKDLAKLLSPYIPSRYSLASSSEFLDLIKGMPTSGTVASLDVESLFTNVPVDTTIDYILDRVYRDDTTPALDIPESALKTLLYLCTKEVPFKCPKGNMYFQKDGVAMGSPLGVLFANFFMGTVENLVFSQRQKPQIYCRYIDDIFVLVEDVKELEELREAFARTSGLHFTKEISRDGTLPFLDILLKFDGDNVQTSVYVKETNSGHCLNGRSECPTRYLDTTIAAYIRRALSHCSSWRTTHEEIDRVSQLLVDNGYPFHQVSRVAKRVIDKWYSGQPPAPTVEAPSPIRIFYRSHMSSSYKTDERIMKNIIRRNVRPCNAAQQLDFVIYYRSKRTSNLLLKNNMTTPPPPLQRSHVVYEYFCQHEDCGPRTSYIGMTTTKLSRRLTCHLQSGTIKTHHLQVHNTPLTRKHLEEGTVILASDVDPRRLIILEALYIKTKNPSINLQNDFLLSLPSSRNVSSRHVQ